MNNENYVESNESTFGFTMNYENYDESNEFTFNFPKTD